MFGAVLVGAIVPAVVAVRRRQLAGLIGRIGLLFHGTDERFDVRRLLEAQSSGTADLRRSLTTALGEIRSCSRACADASRSRRCRPAAARRRSSVA
ncbi:MAG: hypothetical protein WDO24_30365 [Pseudomonadota bacterium]